MNSKRLARKYLGFRLSAIYGATVIAASISTVVLAQGVSPSVAPPSSIRRHEGVGGFGYAFSDTIYFPPSSVERAEDAGKFAHTNYVLRTTKGAPPAPMKSPILTEAETPASLGCVYRVGPAYAGCNPATGGTLHPSGGWGAIALVDAFDDPTATTDISTFSSHFGLPAANLTKVYANGNGNCSTPPPDFGWALEEALDIEWAHAMAPSAKIYLVEACSNSNTDLFYAETVATGLVAAAGGGDISNSWSEDEFSGETSYDNYFRSNQYPQVSNITFIAAAGDFGCGAAYPSSSPWIVSAGGTTVNRDFNGNFVSESCWSGSGGGTSSQERWSNTFTGGNTGAWADFQYPIFGRASRATPDLAFDADPASGVYVYNQYNGGWFIVGGTSVASPALAGIINNAGNRLGSFFLPIADPAGYLNNEENSLLYSQLPAVRARSANFYDITTGSNGCFVGASWDYCTGVGSPRGLLGK